MMNYVCGCSGEGYLGADSLAKQKTLAWLPRVSAILSILGSMFIIYDTTKSQAKRKKVMNQLLCGLSIFDILGAWGYVFTTLPIPEFMSTAQSGVRKATKLLAQPRASLSSWVLFQPT